jgi:hypothetical protein
MRAILPPNFYALNLFLRVNRFINPGAVYVSDLRKLFAPRHGGE